MTFDDLERKLGKYLHGCDVELTRSLIEQGENLWFNEVAYPNNNYMEVFSALETAFMNHRANHFELLLSSGAKPQETGSRSLSLLVANPLCTVEHLKLFAAKLNYQYPDYLEQDNYNPLFTALYRKNITPAHIDYLISLGVPLVTKYFDGDVFQKALQLSAAHENIEILKCIFKYDDDINYVSSSGATALGSAIADKRNKNIKWLIENGVELVHLNRNNHPDYALHEAARCNSSAAIPIFLSNKCNIDQLNAYGQTSLMVACDNTSLSAVDKLLAAGADVNIIDPHGMSAIHYAAKSNKSQIVTSLKQYSSDVDLKDHKGMTALMISAWKSKLHHVNALIDCGASIDITDPDGRTALFYRTHKNENGISTALLKAGADINHQDNDGNTPLHNEVHKKSTQGIKVLVEAGADLNIKNNKGQSVYDIFLKKRNSPKELTVIMEYINLKGLIDDNEDDFSLGL